VQSLAPDYLARLQFDASDASALSRLGHYRGRQELFARQRPEVLQALLEVALVESSESSNRIEGVTAPRARLEALVRRTAEPKSRSEAEIAGYRDALELIHQTARNMPVSVNVILQLHTLLYRYHSGTSGRFKPTDNQIVDRAADGTLLRVRFEPVSAVATPQAMTDLERAYAAAIATELEPLLLVPLFVLDLLCIHPFADGNGRVARLSTLLLLYRHGYEVGRYISLERLIEESKTSYYETLEASSQGWHQGAHDAGPWLRYFWGVLLRAYREYEERVGHIVEGKGSKSQQVRDTVRRRVTPFTITELERDCPGVSRDTIRAVLREMRSEGLIAAEGRGRGAQWRIVATDGRNAD
jgi:Fic family protein